MKNIKFIIAAICILLIIPACGSSSKTSVDPWPGLFRPKETNKRGYKKQQKRDKHLDKLKKKRLKTFNYREVKEFNELKLS